MVRKSLFLLGFLVATLLIPLGVSFLGAADCPETTADSPTTCTPPGGVYFYCASCSGTGCVPTNGACYEFTTFLSNNWTCSTANNYLCPNGCWCDNVYDRYGGTVKQVCFDIKNCIVNAQNQCVPNAHQNYGWKEVKWSYDCP
jgi:hypothetical protein